MLSIFEQSYFIDESKIVKEYPYPIDSEELKLAADILHYSGTNPEERKLIEIEQEAWRTVNAMFKEKEKKYIKELEEKEKLLEEKNKLLEEEKKRAEEERNKIIHAIKSLRMSNFSDEQIETMLGIKIEDYRV